MATFCKTSQGGFNLDAIAKWYYTSTGKGDEIVLDIYLMATDTEDETQDSVVLRGKEAQRALDILEGVCIFDTTQERKP